MDKKAYLQTIDEVIAQGPFTDTWESLGAYETPEWFKQRKFGIFLHWGVYAVPAFNNEWYPRNMYIQGTEEFDYHVKNYGPHKEFGYKDYIPLFKAEKFNADEWAALFKEAGAGYVMPVAEHHDGFQMYKSELSHWNAYEMGPCRDTLGELYEAFKKQDLMPAASSHRIEHWWFLSHGKEFDSDIVDPVDRDSIYWPSMPEQEHQDIHSEGGPTQEFMEDWLLRSCELVDNYKPRAFYFDWWIQHENAKPYIKKFAAYYYNRAHEWGVDVVLLYKDDAYGFGCATPDVERGQFAECKPFYWQTDTAVATNSWSYTEQNQYKKAKDILCDLVDIVSKNGNLLLNVGPKADGTIGPDDTRILKEIGAWMKANGEAIYGTRYWKKSAEGPTVIQEGFFTDAVAKVFTGEDIRFTCKGSTLYVTFLNYQGKGLVKSLAGFDPVKAPRNAFGGLIKSVSVLGYEEKPRWKQTWQGLELETDTIDTEYPVVFKVELD